jgi:hypothetical protein
MADALNAACLNYWSFSAETFLKGGRPGRWSNDNRWSIEGSGGPKGQKTFYGSAPLTAFFDDENCIGLVVRDTWARGHIYPIYRTTDLTDQRLFPPHDTYLHFLRGTNA